LQFFGRLHSRLCTCGLLNDNISRSDYVTTKLPEGEGLPATRRAGAEDSRGIFWFILVALDGAGWSTSRPGRYSPEKEPRVSSSIGERVGPIARLEGCGKVKISRSSRSSNTEPFSHCTGYSSATRNLV